MSSAEKIRVRLLAIAALGLLGGCYDPPPAVIVEGDDDTDTDADPTVGPTSGGPTSGPGVTTDDSDDSTGDDSDDSTGDDSDDSTGEDSTGMSSEVEAAFDFTAEFVGLPTQLDASASNASDGGAVDYTWSIVSAPDDSNITTSDLSSTTNEVVEFVGDVAGTYEISLSVSTADGLTDTMMQSIEVPSYAIPFMVIAGTDDQYTQTIRTVESDGTDEHDVACGFGNTATSTRNWLGDFYDMGIMGFGVRVAQTPEETSRFGVFQGSSLDVLGSEDVEGGLLIGNRETSCKGTAPTTTDSGLIHVVFSPDGSRYLSIDPFEVIDPDGNSVLLQRVVTDAVDGSSARGIRVVPDAALAILSAPSWVDDDRVMWQEVDESGEMDIVRIFATVDEQDGFDNLLQRELLMECESQDIFNEGLAFTQMERLGDDLLAVDGNSGFLILLRLNDQTEMFDCSPMSPNNQVIWNGGRVSDLELNADRTEALFVSSLDDSQPGVAPNASDIYRLGINPPAPPVRFVGDDDAANTAPHWAALGRQVYWTRAVWERVDEDGDGDFDFDRPASVSIMVTNEDNAAAARPVADLVSSPTLTRAVTTGANGFSFTLNCNVGDAGGRAPWGVLLGLVLLGLRRRRSSRV